jgi:NAD(P)-dependent dehydrogenase (short-subunit alcohol dehydrogenase family)
MDLGLNGKLALVTGSTTGIGAAIAEALARESARVIVNGRTEYRVQKAIWPSMLAARPRRPQTTPLFESMPERFGPLSSDAAPQITKNLKSSFP